MRPCLITPTHEYTPELSLLLERAGMPAIVVHTDRRTYRPLDGVENILSFEKFNIQRWWNDGIDAALSLGYSVGVIVNNDVAPADGEQLLRLVDALTNTGATVATVGPEKMYTDWDGEYRLQGWCFALNLEHGFRMDEEFVWFYGDRWLDYQARSCGNGLVAVPINVAHERSRRDWPRTMNSQVFKDARLWENRQK